MVPRGCPAQVGGRGDGIVSWPVWPCGGRRCMVAVLVIRVSSEGLGFGLLSVNTCQYRTRAVRRVAKISLTRAACAARASSSVWMAVTPVPPPMPGSGGSPRQGTSCPWSGGSPSRGAR